MKKPSERFDELMDQIKEKRGKKKLTYEECSHATILFIMDELAARIDAPKRGKE